MTTSSTTRRMGHRHCARHREDQRGLERYDFDLGGTLYDGKTIRAVDCGDVRGDPSTGSAM